MDQLKARPSALKQVNISFIRKLIKQRGTVTRAEVAWETKISSTTVRSLLLQMQHNGEIESIGFDESSGGRKAERYCFKMDKYFGYAFCLYAQEIRALLVNVCGQIVETKILSLEGDILDCITAFLDKEILTKEILSIGVGVPGIVDGGAFWRQNKDGKLEKIEIGAPLAKRYKLPVILENDVNAITMGFEQCYEKMYPIKGTENMNMAFLFFEQGCVSAGFISSGKIIRGINNYAGELSMISPTGKRLFCSEMQEGEHAQGQYAEQLAQILCWICGILNPQYIALGGPAFEPNRLEEIKSKLQSKLYPEMHAEVLYSADIWHDYCQGLATLTSGKMFDEVQLVKEPYEC